MLEINKKYGKLFILEQLPSIITISKNRSSHRKKFLSICDCGNKRIVTSKILLLKEPSCVSCIMYTRRQSLKNNDEYLRPYKLFLNSCIKRGLNNKLSLENFKDLCKENCYYCNTKPELKYWGRKNPFLSGGIDRVNNNKGYDLNNCVPCCKTCNIAKSTLSKNEFLNNISKIYNNMKLNDRI